ncbi:MAG: glycerol-3-phosphate 1-O-acyltransferase PlsY [Candidatus Omnitrophica bacterium]|nr:glycerol-3-phosphate 1-O-acyltransferase PlsY [Candidatus Omnitrophota bacterium]
MISTLVAWLASYLVGSIPTGYVLVQWIKRVDVRTVGSGNIGATNVTRIAGAGLGRLVFVLDAIKGLLAVWGFAPWLIHPLTPTMQLLCGLLAVLGHMFPVFLKFQGGKGVATTIGIVAGTMPWVAAASLLVWVCGFFLTRYVSVASLAAAVVIPLGQLATHRAPAEIGLGTLLALLIVMRHRANIDRLLHGREHRFHRKDAQERAERRHLS